MAILTPYPLSRRHSLSSQRTLSKPTSLVFLMARSYILVKPNKERIGGSKRRPQNSLRMGELILALCVRALSRHFGQSQKDAPIHRDTC